MKQSTCRHISFILLKSKHQNVAPPSMNACTLPQPGFSPTIPPLLQQYKDNPVIIHVFCNFYDSQDIKVILQGKFYYVSH